MVRWLSWTAMALIDEMILLVLKPIPVCETNRTVTRLRRLFSVAVIGWALMAFGFPFHVKAAEVSSSLPVKVRKTVAAGVGFQNADSSTITVKTYDAESGEVLSDESYELDIKEDGPAVSPQPRERIFAGGIGIGSDGLSDFTLRVYDAVDGRFLWEGRLNLNVRGQDAETVPVVAHIQPRAAISRISQGSSHRDGQPSFLLRVRNPETGQLVWSDQFSTEMSSVRAERINRGVVGLEPRAPRDVDFRIQMFDEAGQQLLWEDKVTQVVEESNASSDLHDEDAGATPLWWFGPGDLSIRDLI
jgi:hypothetical protein